MRTQKNAEKRKAMLKETAKETVLDASEIEERYISPVDIILWAKL